jgi:hypothetical protein
MSDSDKKTENSSKGKWHGGKGSLPRKGDNKTAYEEGWERIFGNKDQKTKQAQVTDLNWDGNV